MSQDLIYINRNLNAFHYFYNIILSQGIYYILHSLNEMDSYHSIF